MNFKTIATLTLLLFSVANVIGQKQLIIERKNNSSKKKYLDLTRDYDIKTVDTTYLSKKIVAFSDSTISITTWIKTGRDSTYSYTTNEKLYTDTRPIYQEDTVSILFQNIQVLKKDWFRNRGWAEPFAWFGAGAVIGVALLPAAAISQGSEGVKEWAIFEAIIVGISAPPLFIVTRKTRYNLKKKWTLKSE